MQYDEFIQQVRQRQPDIHPHEAEAGVEAVFQLLGQALPEQEARAFAGQLPRELAEVLHATAAQAPADLDEETFYTRVAELADLSGDDAVAYTSAVMDVLRDAITKGELVEVTLALPPALEDLVA